MLSPRTKDARLQAMSAIKERRLSLREASREYGVPKSCLSRLARGETNVEFGSGKPTELHPHVEDELAKVCLFLKDAHVSVERRLIQRIALKIARETGVPGGFLPGV